MGTNGGGAIRFASPNERRVISRENLGYYRSLYVGGLYTCRDGATDLSAKTTYLPALRKCIATHPPLSVVVADAETEKPFYRVNTIRRPEDHVLILPAVSVGADLPSQLAVVEEISPGVLDAPPAVTGPQWKIVVQPFRREDGTRGNTCFIALAFSHALGDGISGLAFHKTLLSGLRDPESCPSTDTTPACLSEPYDTAGKLPVSWSFLLSPLLGVYLPTFAAKLLGFRTAAIRVTPRTWLGGLVRYDQTDHRTATRIFSIESTLLKQLLTACRAHDVKLTGLFHQAIVHALSVVLAEDVDVDNFASQTAINMRPAIGISNDEMGLFVSGFFAIHPRSSQMAPAEMWKAAREMTAQMHEQAGRLQDQPIALLRYLPSIRSWTSGHLGGKRDFSYEISNLLAFDPEQSGRPDGSTWTLGNMFFSQPANVTGAPLTFNVVSREGGDLTCAVSWQASAVGVGEEAAELRFVERVREEMLAFFRTVVS